jgi:hypothetical protein
MSDNTYNVKLESEAETKLECLRVACEIVSMKDGYADVLKEAKLVYAWVKE